MMRAAVCVLVLLTFTVSGSRSSVDVYPPLTRETLVGTWETVCGIGQMPVVFHIVISATESDSYLAEIYPHTMKGRLYRLDVCKITNEKVYLEFREVVPIDQWASAWWIEGEGFGDAGTGWIRGRIGTQSNRREDAGQSNLYLAKGTWVRSFGEASVKAEEKIAKARREAK